ncbi:MAG: hypothetical protein ACRD2R_05705, partial [Terriglobales bacterium]
MRLTQPWLGILLFLAGSLAARAQHDWSPPYVPPQAEQAPASAPASPASTTPPVKQYKEYTEEPAAPAAAASDAVAPGPAPAAGGSMTSLERELRDIAQRFAPVLHQRLAGTPEDHRYDYPTNFDFDGDWVGNNNWQNAADPRYKLWSFVYYSVIESEDHYFIHYAVFHPRDWSLAEPAYTSLLDKLQEKYKEIVGKKVREEVEFNHENDLEGALVIV